MISPLKSGIAPLVTKGAQARDNDVKTESSRSSSKVQSIKEGIQKGEYKFNLMGTSEKMALNLLNRG
ncbi:MAG: hypothetical protein ACTTH5_06100 [Wolinella sp.]